MKPARSSYEAHTEGPTSTESDRFKALHEALDAHMHALFQDAQAVFAYGMHAWKVPRRREVEWTRGTMDPNWLFVGLAERKAGLTLHVWNPIQYDGLEQRRATLEAAGFKVMVGCLQFNRKSEFPLQATKDLLTAIRRQMDTER